VFATILTINSDYFLVQHSPTGLSNRSTSRSLQGTKSTFMYVTQINFSLQRVNITLSLCQLPGTVIPCSENVNTAHNKVMFSKQKSSKAGYDKRQFHLCTFGQYLYCCRIVSHNHVSVTEKLSEKSLSVMEFTHCVKETVLGLGVMTLAVSVKLQTALTGGYRITQTAKIRQHISQCNIQFYLKYIPVYILIPLT
jgi:hypothetical protein